MANAAAMRRKQSNKRFDGNVTRSVSTSSKTAAAGRKPDDGIGLGVWAIIGFVVLVVGSSLVEILRPNL